MTVFRLAVLSDLHAAPQAVAHKPGEVRLFTDLEDGAPADHPMLGLKSLISSEGLTANAIICPGDMTNKANAQALRYVWRNLHEISELMKAAGVVATVGNHDVDSRTHDGDSFPREALMRLDPRFPSGYAATSDQYWAHGFCFQDMGIARFLVLNTCWLHEARDELERGVLTTYTLERVKEDLRTLPKRGLNIVVCHHHPHPHAELGLGVNDVTRNGQRLLDMLSDDGYWMVIHGHKHHPKIEYAQGQFRQAIVLACGSFSGRLEGDNALVSQNYFHLIEIKDLSQRIAGVVRSWHWVPGLGWKEYSSSPPEFPSRIGFGAASKIESLAAGIATAVSGNNAVDWGTLTNGQPELEFLMPRQLSALISLLSNKYQITTLYDDLGHPAQLGPKLHSSGQRGV